MRSFSSLQSAALVSVTAAATTFLIQACGGGAVAQPAGEADLIEGVWEATVTVKDCATGAMIGQPFPALLAFQRGGSVGIDNTARSSRGNIYGVWRRSTGAGAANGYAVNVIHQRFNPDGTYAGNNRIDRTLTLAADGNTFTASLVVKVLNTSGVVVSQLCPTETAVRVDL